MDWVYAMGTGPGGGSGGAAPGGGMMGALLPLLLMFLVFYILLIRPQQKRSKEHREFLDRTGTREAVEVRRFESIIEEMMGDHIIERLRREVPRDEFESMVADVVARRMDKSEAVDRLLERIMEAR